MTQSVKKLQIAIGTVGTLIIGEHFFSTMLSSPWTTQKFAEKPEDKEVVRRLYILASFFSLVTAILVAYLLRESAPIYATLVLILIYVWIYERSLKKQL